MPEGRSQIRSGGSGSVGLRRLLLWPGLSRNVAASARRVRRGEWRPPYLNGAREAGAGSRSTPPNRYRAGASRQSKNSRTTRSTSFRSRSGSRTVRTASPCMMHCIISARTAAVSASRPRPPVALGLHIQAITSARARRSDAWIAAPIDASRVPSALISRNSAGFMMPGSASRHWFTRAMVRSDRSQWESRAAMSSRTFSSCSSMMASTTAPLFSTYR
uniref:Uncharacterized protein n=1 Tax=uncultured bacterium fosmid pJB190D12_contig II TaxID=1478060 RepID=A0A0H3U7A6_9BACT|nr:hypothetical protein [uncultured bacterium fosmid pJB190D12_contig II]